MNLVQAHQLLESYFATNWTYTPIAFENVDARNWALPGQPLLPEGDVDYVMIRTTLHASETITVPGTCRRYFGTIFVGAAVKDGSGVRQAEQYASDLIELLENKELASDGGRLRIWTVASTVKYRPTSEWYVYELSFNYSFERYTLS